MSTNPMHRGHSPLLREKVERNLADPGVRAEVGADQIAYYRARAPWYDDTYTCQGDYDAGPVLNAQWLNDVGGIEEALIRAGLQGDCVDLGAGTGFWTDKV